MKYTLRQIEVFLAVAHHQNVSRAAEQLSLSQSAASGALKELENQFEIQLFNRMGKRLQINEQGRLLRIKAESLLAMAAELENEFIKHNTLSQLNIGATLTIGNYLCVDLINLYLGEAPEAKIHLDIANTEHIKHALLNFDIDIGMLEGEIHHPDLDIWAWRDDELRCFCSPEHPLAHKKTLSMSDFINASWILREIGSGTRQTFDRAMAGHLSELNITLELEQTEAIKRAVAGQLGIGCISEIALAEDFDRGHFIELPSPMLTLSRTLYVAMHKHKFKTASLQRWLSYLN